MMFHDRYDAGRKLAKEFQRRDFFINEPIVIALPKGGIPVAYCLAEELGYPLDFISLKKIGAPYNPELAIGAVSEDGEAFFNEELVNYYDVSDSSREQMKEKSRKEAFKQAQSLYEGRMPPVLEGKDVILVDDGIATGATVKAAIKLLRKKNVDQIILAVPVCSLRTWKELMKEIDYGVILEEPRNFYAVGQWYEHFEQTSLDEAKELLKTAKKDESHYDTSSSSIKKSFIPIQKGELPCIAYVPVDPKGWVIFVHGSGSSYQSPRNRWVAKELYEKGYASLLFDLLTSEEDMDPTNRFDIPLLTKRLKNAYTWLIKQSYYRPGLPVGFFGASTGAAAALSAANELEEQMKPFAIVSRGGRPDLAGEDTLSQVQVPTLFIVGGHDYQVIEINEEAKKFLRDGKISLVKGATHLFEEPGALEDVSRQALEWFDKNLPATGEIFHRQQQNVHHP